MIYRSNLISPDLSAHFRHQVSYPRPWSFGHDVPSDRDFEPECGSLTHDELAILCNLAHAGPMQSHWCDIGCRFGWTSKHINWITNGPVTCVDPQLRDRARWDRFLENTGFPTHWLVPLDAERHFKTEVPVVRYDGVFIDGNHDSPCPLEDAMNAARFAARTCCIVFHDAWGKPIRDGVRWLMDNGWNARMYWTPNGMAACWRGDFVPPDHVPDPVIKAQMTQDRMPDFDLGRCL